MNPSFSKPALDNAFLELLDRHRWLVDAEHARGFAGCWTDASSKLWEIVCSVQLSYRLSPLAAVYEVVPVRDKIVDGTSGVAERDAAIHATGSLLAQFRLAKIGVNLKPIVDALGCGTSRREFACMIEKARDFTQVGPRPALRPEVACSVGLVRSSRAHASDRVGRL